jgi:hypothetical protein
MALTIRTQSSLEGRLSHRRSVTRSEPKRTGSSEAICLDREAGSIPGSSTKKAVQSHKCAD